jgi:hypothetical protein
MMQATNTPDPVEPRTAGPGLGCWTYAAIGCVLQGGAPILGIVLYFAIPGLFRSGDPRSSWTLFGLIAVLFIAGTASAVRASMLWAVRARLKGVK